MDHAQHTTNGYHSLPPSGPDAFHLGKTLGGIEERLGHIERRIQKLETSSVLGLSPIHFVQVGIGITVLGAAITGRISWGESLPIVGRMFGG